MRFKILIPLLAAFALQSCTERADEAESREAAIENVNTNVPVATTYTGAEPAAAAPDVKENEMDETANAVEANTLHQNMNKTAKRSSATPAKKAPKKESDIAYINAESQNTPGFKTRYQVPREQYAAEAKAAKENTAKRAAKEEYTYHKKKVTHGNMYATYDEPGDAYEGEEVMSNDGVKKNKERNINYLDFSVSKAPSDGGSFSKK